MADPSPAKTPFNSYPWYAPRFWHGLRAGDWWSLLARHHFGVALEGLGLAFTVTNMSLANSMAAGLQWLIHGRAIEATEIREPPLFIIGHWRSGTTLLHELFSLDTRYSSPNTYQCFAPHHFLISEPWATRMFWFLVPPTRPMDNMAAGFDRPQEDEFALMNLGNPSPMSNLAFPNQKPRYYEYLDMEGLTPEELARWKESLLFFLKALTYHTGKPVVFKSPPHTGRIGVLHEMFPDARFLHIVRDPYSIVPSSIRLWQSLGDGQGFQEPRNEHVEEWVFENYRRMYGGFFKHRDEIAPQRLYEIRYEDLVKDPPAKMREIYEKLDLGGFDKVEAPLAEYLTQQKDYKTNKHQLEPELKAKIDDVWREYQERYGYR